jgi:hypothetical protein
MNALVRSNFVGLFEHYIAHTIFDIFVVAETGLLCRVLSFTYFATPMTSKVVLRRSHCVHAKSNKNDVFLGNECDGVITFFFCHVW